MKVVCCAKKIRSVVCVCMGTSDAIDKKGKNVLFCSFLFLYSWGSATVITCCIHCL